MEKTPVIRPNDDSTKIRLKSGAISEKGLAFSVMQSGREQNIILDMSYKAFWIGDIVAWRIFEDYGLPQDEETRQLLKWNREDLLKVERYFTDLQLRYPREFDKQVLNVIFTCDDVRERTGKYYLSNRKVYELVREFSKGSVTRLTKPFLMDDGDTEVVRGRMGQVCEIDFIKTSSRSNRTKEPEYYFRPLFISAQGINFFLSIRLGLFDFRPLSYYAMSEGAQWIVRAYGWDKRPSHPSLEELIKIANIKGKNKTDQQRKIESYLDEAQSERYLKGWKKDKKRVGRSGRLEIKYHLYKVNRWPRK